MYNKKPVRTQIEQADLKQLRTIVILFIISMIIPLFISLIDGHFLNMVLYAGYADYSYGYLGSIVTVIGYVAFVYGLYSVSRKNIFLKSNVKIVYLFLLVIILESISLVVNLVIPQLATIISKEGLNYFTKSHIYLPFLMLQVVISVVVSIILLFAIYYFTRWFNEEITPFNPTKTFLYFGVLNAIGAVTSGISTWSILRNRSIFVVGSNALFILITLFILIAGYICVIAAFLMEIVAGVKIYIRIHDITTGRAYLQNQHNYIQIEPKDLRIFRALIAVFSVSMLLFLVGIFFIGYLASIIRVIGYIALTYGVYRLCKNYKSLESSKKIVYSFLLIIILEISFIVVSFANSQLSFSSLDSNLTYSMIQIVFSVPIALVFLIAMHYFTNWFNKEISPFNQTQIFWWFNLVNVFIIGIGLYLWFVFNYPPPKTPVNSRYPFSPIYLLLFALFLLVFGIITFASVIFAEILIYDRITDLITGVTYFKNQPLGQPSNNQPSKMQNFNQLGGTKFCQNCNYSLEPNTAFCANCGMKV